MVRLHRRRRLLLAALLGLVASVSFASAQTVVGWGAFSTPPNDLGPVIKIAAGGSHYLALQSDGTVRAWGLASNCQINVPAGLTNVVAIATGDYHSLALRADGTVETWGCDTKWELGAVPGEATNIVQIAAGQRHSLAVRADGTVVAWGVNDDGQCDVPDDLHAVAIAAGGAFSVAVKANRTLTVWGNNFFGQCQPPEGLRELVAIAAGSNHALALRTDGTVIAWGDNSYGQCDLPADLTGVSAISAYANYSLALKADGTVVSWGWGGAKFPADLTNVVGIAADSVRGLALVGAASPYLVRGIADYDAVLGSTVTFAAAVRGAEPLSFQWFKDGQALADGDGLAGTATPQLVIEKARLEDSAEYWLVASNASGTVTTSPAQLDVFAAPRIERQPEPADRSLGSTTTLSVTVSGVEPMTYQWFRSGTPLADNDKVGGANQSSLELRGLEFSDSGAYAAVISNAFGSVTSHVAQVTVGQIDGWGENWCGELDVPPGLDDVVMLAAGDLHALALRSDGTVVAWGDNLHGQCDVPEDLHDAVAIAAGGSHSLALRRNGTVVTWGYDKRGLLQVPSGLDQVTAIAAGINHSLALRADGTVVCWGFESPLNSEVASDLREVVAIAAGGRQSMALKANGTIFTWGGRDYGNPPPGLRDVVGIAAGAFHSLALKGDGTVVGWGPKFAPAALVPEGLSNVVQIAAGAHFSVALKRDGTVVAWGRSNSGQSSPPAGLQGVVNIAAGGAYTLVLKGDGRPWLVNPPHSRKVTLGRQVLLSANISGTEPLSYRWLKDGQPLDNVAGVTGTDEPNLTILRATYDHEGYYQLTVSNALGAVTTEPFWLSVNQVVGWGDDAFEQADVPAYTRDVVTLAAGDSHTLALHSDGSLSAWGEGGDDQTDVPEGQWVAVAAGAFHNVGLRPDGTVAAWGRNRSGQCDVPVGLSNVVAIAAGGAHSLALRADGTVVAWGKTLVPPGLSNIVAIAAGKFHSLALRANGEVVAWGYNRVGQCVVSPGLSDVVRIAAGGYHSSALRRDGTVVAWGLNRSGQCDVPPDLSNVVAIAAGGHHSLALRADGSVVAWGLNQSGQCDPPTDYLRAKAIAAGRIHSLAVAAEGPPEFLRPIWVEAVASGGVRLQGFPLGDAPMTYQWFRGEQPLNNGGGVAGADTSVLLLEAEAATPDSYSLRAVNALGEARSVPTDLSTALGPRLRMLPSGREVLQGSRVLLTADVDGALPMTFQWLWNGVPLVEGAGRSGTTSPVLEIEAVTPGDVGEYRLAATNADGSAVSAGQNLTVCSIRAWGDNRYGQSMLPYPLRGIKAISALADHALALREDGTAEAWGDNSYKECDVPLGLTGVVQLAAGDTHSMALTAGGTVVVWGGPTRGLQIQPPNVTNIMAIAASGGAGCFALRSDNQILSWAPWWRVDNPAPIPPAVEVVPDILSYGPFTGGTLRSLLTQQARGNKVRSLGTMLDMAPGFTYHHAIISDRGVEVWRVRVSPIIPAVLPLTDIVALASGFGQPCLALSANGTAISWQAGQTERVSFTEFAADAVAVAVGRDFQLALTSRGDVVGSGTTVLPPPNLHYVSGLSAGGGHNLAVTRDGRVVAWGENTRGQCNIPADASNVVSVAAGFDVPYGASHSLALRNDGRVIAWGDNHTGQCDVPATLSNVLSVAAGAGHSLALLANGTITAWGDNTFGQCTVPADLSPVLAIAAGGSHNLALKTDSTVTCWGANDSGQCDVPEGLSDVVAVAAGKYHSVALRHDGSVVTWGATGGGLADTVNWSNIVAIAAGGMNTVGLKGDGTVVVAGNDTYGQNDVPTDLRNVDQIAAGDGFVLAITGEGPLARALGGAGFAWRTGGQQPWIAQMQVTRDGTLAAQSGAVQPGEESWLETTVRGPGVLRFWWRLAPAGTTASLELFVNGGPVAALTQATDWEPKAVGVRPGLSTVRWRYTRESGTPEPDSGAWLDAVEFSPVEPPTLAVLWVDASQVEVRFDSVEGLAYVLQSAASLQGAATEWTPVSTVVGTGQPAVVPVQIEDGATRFFRLVIE